jgi:phosphatidylinositol 4-kinase
MQLIEAVDQIFKTSQVDLWLFPYEILATGPNCGLIECISDADSIDGLKKSM